jgi:hypothetical protein
MVWVKLDDSFASHPKVIGISDSALRSHIAAMCHAGRYLTDGFVHDPVIATFATLEIRAELVRAGLWVEGEGGILIHDFLTYNFSRAQVEAKRAADAERQRQWREEHRADDSGRFT